MHILKEYSDGERSAFELWWVQQMLLASFTLLISTFSGPILSLSLPCSVAEFLTLDLYSVCL